MKKSLLFLFLVTSGLFVQSQETFPVNGTSNKNHTPYAFMNARIVTDAEHVIDNGTMIIRDGIIIAVGTKISIPKGAVMIDLKGKSIYPGLIDAYTSYGMPETRRNSSGPNPQM